LPAPQASAFAIVVPGTAAGAAVIDGRGGDPGRRRHARDGVAGRVQAVLIRLE
jgi:hypothetical protein